MTVIDNKYEIGDRVDLVSDPDQLLRVVTSFHVYKAGEIMYNVACGERHSEHYEFELSTEKDLTLSD